MQVFDSLPERQLWGHWLTPRSTAAMVRSGATLRRPAHKADRPLFSGKTTFAGVSSLDGLAPKAVIPTAAPDMRGSNVGRSRSIRFGEVRIPPSVTRIDGIVVRDHACCSGIQAAVCNMSPYGLPGTHGPMTPLWLSSPNLMKIVWFFAPETERAFLTLVARSGPRDSVKN
jgi:hypothetical protein